MRVQDLIPKGPDPEDPALAGVSKDEALAVEITLQAAREGLEGGIAAQRVPPGGDDVVDLLGRQPEAGGDSVQHSGARRIELIEAEASDKEFQVVAIPAR